jgi:hypothetical protein
VNKTLADAHRRVFARPSVRAGSGSVSERDDRQRDGAPLNELIGQFDSIKFDELKAQIRIGWSRYFAAKSLFDVDSIISRGDRSTASANLGSVMQQVDSAIGRSRQEFSDAKLVESAFARRNRAHDQRDSECAVERLLIAPIRTAGRSCFAKRDAARELGAG